MKSIEPLVSLSKILKISSTKTWAFPSGNIIEYISTALYFFSFPLGQSTIKPLQSYKVLTLYSSSSLFLYLNQSTISDFSNRVKLSMYSRSESCNSLLVSVSFFKCHNLIWKQNHLCFIPNPWDARTYNEYLMTNYEMLSPLSFAFLSISSQNVCLVFYLYFVAESKMLIKKTKN